MKSLSKLFGVSVDSLLNDGSEVSSSIIKESIDILQYKRPGKLRSVYDSVVKEKYPDADVIFALQRSKNLSAVEKAIDFIVGSGVLQTSEALRNIAGWYLVEYPNKRLLVKVTNEFIESRELNYHFTKKNALSATAFLRKSVKFKDSLTCVHLNVT